MKTEKKILLAISVVAVIIIGFVLWTQFARPEPVDEFQQIDSTTANPARDSAQKHFQQYEDYYHTYRNTTITDSMRANFRRKIRASVARHSDSVRAN